MDDKKKITTTFEVHDFFGGLIPAEWKAAKEQFDDCGYECSKDLYLSAYSEQENP